MKPKMELWMKNHENEMFAFLRALIAVPSTSCCEKEVVTMIADQMTALDYDEIVIDAMGNVLGRVGYGPRTFALDGHIDTVDVGVVENWTFDPFNGKEDDTYIYGRGASDQTGGFVSALYAGAMLKALDLLDGISVWVVGSVQEEDCDGLCWRHILTSKRIQPELVVITEPTNLNVYRGHRGRMEIGVEVTGVSAHGSAPERGENAIYKMAEILLELQELNTQLKTDDFLGKGTLAVSEIFFTSPSRCAVADGCSISVDRRLTAGETPESAVAEIQQLKSVQKYGAKAFIYQYDKPSYKGLEQSVDCTFPTWTVPEDFYAVTQMAKAHRMMHLEETGIDKWTFSTNGTTIMGVHGVPCVGYGPGEEREAHAPNEKIRKRDLIKAVGTYAYFISTLLEV